MKLLKGIQTLDQLKKEYRKLAVKYHPDNTATGNEDLMKVLNDEYEILFPRLKMVYAPDSTESANSTRREFYTQNGWKGSNYNQNLSTKEITAKIRAYVKEEFNHCRFSVTFSSYSGGSSIGVTLTEAPENPYIDEREIDGLSLNHFYLEDNKDLKAEYKTMFILINSFICSYRMDDSDSMIDYFHTNFYYNLHIGKYNKPFSIVHRVKKSEKVSTVVKEEQAAEQKETVKADNVEIKYNEEKNGIELYFEAIPSEEVRTALKSNGFKWSKFNKCWYVKDTKETREFLNKLFSQPSEEAAEPQQEEVKQSEILVDKAQEEIIVNEELVNETCKSVFVEMLDDDIEIFVHGDFADINKNKTLEDYKHMVKEYGSKVIECKVTHVAVLTSSQWDIITNSFMYDCPLFAGLGGSGSHYEPTKEYEAFYNMPEWEREQWINQAYNLCVLVINADTKESILVDPQGHNYARYVAFTDAKEVETLVNGYIKLYQNYKEIEQLEKEMQKDVEIVAEIAREEVKKVTIEQAEINVPQEEEKQEPVYSISYNINETKKGIEVKIKGTIGDNIRQQLKQNGFTWFKSLGLYIAKISDTRLSFIQELATI